MGTEKTIKNQAKKLLAGNWGSIIAVIVLVCIGAIALDTAGTLIAFLLRIYNTSGEFVNTDRNHTLYNYILTGEFIVFILFSPVINGIFKMFSNISLYGKTEISDAFFYFKNSLRYFKSCIFNLILSFIYILLITLTDLAYGCLEDAVGKNLQDMANFDIINIILIGVMVLVIALKILFYFVFVHYQIFAFATFDNISIPKCVFGMYGFAFRHLGSAIKMIFSFAGWILLCFFVVPAFYVFPYLAVSMANSAKWLFAYDKDRGILC